MLGLYLFKVWFIPDSILFRIQFRHDFTVYLFIIHHIKYKYKNIYTAFLTVNSFNKILKITSRKK